MTEAAPRATFPLALALAWLLGASPAAAHSVHVFAEGAGSVIRGKVYFRGGSPTVDAQVTAFGPDGRKLGQTRTDAQGAFTLPATIRCDHRLLVATADGHGAEFRVAAEELSTELPSPGAEDEPGNHGKPQQTSSATPAEVPPPHSETAPMADELAALRGQISSLRAQLLEYERRTRLRDVLGGIGYILGLAGIGFYVTARRAGQAGKA